MPTYTTKDRAAVIEGWQAGKTWAQIGAEIPDARGRPRSPETVQRYVRRLRKKGEWPADVEGVRELPSGIGRPRNLRRSRKISPRFSVGVTQAIRAVGEAADLRLGEVMTQAIERHLARVSGEKLEPEPLGLVPGASEVVIDGPKSETLSCAVDEESFAALLDKLDTRDNTAVSEAVVKLLADLNYRITKP